MKKEKLVPFLPSAVAFCSTLLTVILLAWRTGSFSSWKEDNSMFRTLSSELADPLRQSLPKFYDGNFSVRLVPDSGSSASLAPLVEEPGAPIQFVTKLFSDRNVTDQLSDCFGIALRAGDEDPECQFLDTSFLTVLVGTILVPILVAFCAIVFSLLRRSTKICGSPEPTMLYPPPWQITVFIFLIVGIFFLMSWATIGLAGMSHYNWSIDQASEGLERVDQVLVHMAPIVNSTEEELSSEARMMLGDANRMMIDGSNAIASNEMRALWDEMENYKAAVLDLTSYISSSANPLCPGDRCPVCTACQDVVASINEQQVWLAQEDQLKMDLQKPFDLGRIPGDVGFSANQLRESVDVLAQHGQQLFQASSPLRESFKDHKITRTILSSVQWGFVFIAALTLFIAVLGAHEKGWNYGFGLTVWSCCTSFILWGLASVFVVPHNTICEVLPPATSPLNPSMASAYLFSTLSGPIDPRFRVLFDRCILHPEQTTWSSIGVTQDDIMARLFDWDIYAHVHPDVLDFHLNPSVRFGPYNSRSDILVALQPEAVGYNSSCTLEEACPNFNAHEAFLEGLEARMSTTRLRRIDADLQLNTVAVLANTLRADFGLKAVAISNMRNDATRRLLDLGNCAQFSAYYEDIRHPFCTGAKGSGQTIWISLFIVAVTCIPLLLIIIHSAKHFKQRARDAESPMLNVMVMFNFKLYKKVKRHRWKESAKAKHPIHPDIEAGQVIAPHSDVVFNLGKGVDGWGHEPNMGTIPAAEIEPSVYPDKAVDFSHLESSMIKGHTEAEHLWDPTQVSRLDASNLIKPGDKRELEVDKRTGKLRWRKKNRERRRSSILANLNPGERAQEKLYDALIQDGAIDQQQLADKILKMFLKLDEDKSGAIDREELRLGLAELGYKATTFELGALIKKFDSSKTGLLDLSDFRALVMSALEREPEVEQKKDPVAAQPEEYGEGADGRLLPSHGMSVKVNGFGWQEAIWEQEKPPTPPPVEPHNPEKERMRMLFKKVDVQNEGELNGRQLQRLGLELGQKWSQGFAEDVMTLLDADGSGTLDFEELWKWYSEFAAGRHQAKKLPELGVAAPSYNQLAKYRAAKRLERAGEGMFAHARSN